MTGKKVDEVAEDVRYRNTELYNGNAAYEVVWQEEEQQSSQPARRRAARRRVHRRYGLSVTAVLGVIVVAAMIVIALMSYAAYTATAAEAISVRSQVEELEDANRKLTVAYEAAFDMNEVKTYAQTVLGMNQPAADQTGYVRLETQDSVAVCTHEGGESVLSGITAMISAAIGGR